MNNHQEQQIPRAELPPPSPPPQQQRNQQYGLTNAQKQYALLTLKQEKARQAAQKKQDSKDRRSRVEEMLEPENRATPVVFNGLSEYRAMDDAYKSLSNRDEDEEEEAVYMAGFPVTDADRAPFVAQLTTAIMDMSNVTDKDMKRPAAGKKKLTAGSELMTNTAVKAIQNLSNFEVQLLAWKILCATCDAHLGLHNIPSWTKVWKYNSYENFGERFRDVRHAIRRCKALLKSIIDTDIPFVKRLAAGPRDEYKMKQENREMNERRAAEREESKKLQPYVSGPGGQTPLPGYQQGHFPSRDHNSETNANGGTANNLSLQSSESVMYSQDGNIDNSGDDGLDTAVDTTDYDFTDFDITTFDTTAIDYPDIGGQGDGPGFEVDQPGDVNGAANNELSMPPWAQHGQTANQASTELSIEGTGGQADGLEETTGHQELNTGTSAAYANRENLQKDVGVPDGQDTSEYNDLLATEKEMLEFDLFNAFSPNIQQTPATPNDSTETQVSMHGLLLKVADVDSRTNCGQQGDCVPARVNQAENSSNLALEESTPAAPAITSQDLGDQIEYETFMSGEDD